VDDLQHVGTVPKAVTAGNMAAAAAGLAGLRLYQFETSYDYLGEKQQVPGSGGGIQTGMAPFYGEVNNWRAMAYSANVLTKAIQPYILGRFLNSPAYGRNLVTGARQSAAGNMLIIVNGFDGTRTISPDFRPFKSGAGEARYRLADTFIKTALLPDENGETITLEAGETAVYLFPNASASAPMDTVSFQFPDASGFQAVLRYGYVYRQNVSGFGDAIDCTNGCSVGLDRKLGDIFYDYVILDSCGHVVKQGPQALLGASNQLAIHTQGLQHGDSCQ
jgi:hypothetical protein